MAMVYVQNKDGTWRKMQKGENEYGREAVRHKKAR